jgi:hypothetical protein
MQRATAAAAPALASGVSERTGDVGRIHAEGRAERLRVGEAAEAGS